jgi:hypothetical protein
MWLPNAVLLSNFTLQLIAASTGFWLLLFLITILGFSRKGLTDKQTWDIRNRLVSAVHGVFAYYSSVYALTYWRGFGLVNSPLETFIVSVSLGYFIYDTLAMFCLSLNDMFITFHHIAVIAGLSGALYTDMGGAEITWGYIITEGSNAFLHTKEITRAVGMKETRFYVLVELLFIGAYYCGRFLVGVPGVFWIVTSTNTPGLVKTVAFLLEVQSFEWGYRMTKILKKRMGEYRERESKGVSLTWFIPLKA